MLITWFITELFTIFKRLNFFYFFCTKLTCVHFHIFWWNYELYQEKKTLVKTYLRCRKTSMCCWTRCEQISTWASRGRIFWRKIRMVWFLDTSKKKRKKKCATSVKNAWGFGKSLTGIDILVIIDALCGRGSWSEHRDQLLGVNNALKETKIRMWNA